MARRRKPPDPEPVPVSRPIGRAAGDVRNRFPIHCSRCKAGPLIDAVVCSTCLTVT